MSKLSIKNKIKDLLIAKRKGVAWLIDPDKIDLSANFKLKVENALNSGLDFFFVGGSLISNDRLQNIIVFLKSLSAKVPVVIFPGNQIHFCEDADALLYLSLVSGRNPEYLIGQHVTIAPLLARSTVEVLSTAYLLVDGGQMTSVNYISQTLPLPNNKPDLSVATALAAHFLGMGYFYLDTGSGALQPVPREIISAVKGAVMSPLIVGGGLDSIEKVKNAFDAGADIVVIGNGAEKNPDFLIEVLGMGKEMNGLLNINERLSSSHLASR